MTTHRPVTAALAALVLALTAVLVAGAPAEAVAGSALLGHRCRHYDDPTANNEDTVKALINTGGVAGASCEVDAWTLADGHVIIWHDNTWSRVADHSTLPPGVAPTDLVKNATLAQVRQIRTKGGQPVPTLAGMIKASGKYGVPLVVEIRNTIPSGSWVSYASSHGANVRYYKTPADNCDTVVLDRLRDAGAAVGLKLGAVTACAPTPAQIQAKGVSFVTVPASRVTRSYTSDLRSRGVKVFASGATRSTARTILAKGAVKLIVDHPRRAATW